MFIDLNDDPRVDPPGMGDERTTLVGFLRWQRETLELKCSGLDAEQLARRSVEPSTMSLLGLVRHMADVERSWFRRFMAGLDAPKLFPGDIAFDDAAADPAMVSQAWALWRDEIAFADQFVADAPTLDLPGKQQDSVRGPMSLRWILTHMIEEYARHLGHVDLLRERIDGKLGQ
jgi:uncharacterized damage-inducible protein DinB